MPLITLDGSHEEGGGAILRVALALSTATGQSFKIINIRANRPEPGLKQQHIVGIKALQEWSGAKVTDCHPGSTELMFIPGTATKSHLSIHAGTAAPVTLILQAILPAIAHHGRKCTLTMTGGTDVKWSPPIDYFANVFGPAISQYADIKVMVKKRGYFPKGGGQVEIQVQPHREKTPLDLTERGNLLRFAGVSHAAFPLEPARVAERQSQAARIYCENHYTEREGNYPITINTQYYDTPSTGSGIVVWAEYENIRLGADVLGERGLQSEVVGEMAAKRVIKLMNDESGVVDPWLADQLIPYLALFGGAFTTTEVTAHARANMHVCEQFLGGEFIVSGNRISYEKKKD